MTLADLWDELLRGKVYECSLRDPHWHLDGLADGDCVYIDPRPAIVLTLLHELLHRRRPRWSERRVTRESCRLLSHMQPDEMARWWAKYNHIKTRRRPKPVDDES